MQDGKGGAIVSHNASPEAHPEMVKKGRARSAQWDRYGEGIIPLALDTLAGRNVPMTAVRNAEDYRRNVDMDYMRSHRQILNVSPNPDHFPNIGS